YLSKLVLYAMYPSIRSRKALEEQFNFTCTEILTASKLTNGQHSFFCLFTLRKHLCMDIARLHFDIIHQMLSSLIVDQLQATNIKLHRELLNFIEHLTLNANLSPQQNNKLVECILTLY